MDLSTDHDHAVKAHLVQQFADYISCGVGSVTGVLGASAGAVPRPDFFGPQ